MVSEYFPQKRLNLYGRKLVGLPARASCLFSDPIQKKLKKKALGLLFLRKVHPVRAENTAVYEVSCRCLRNSLGATPHCFLNRRLKYSGFW